MKKLKKRRDSAAINVRVDPIVRALVIEASHRQGQPRIRFLQNRNLYAVEIVRP